MLRNLNTIVIILFLSFITKAANAQFQITNIDALPDVKKSTTYVELPDTARKEFNQFKAIFRKYWTYTPVKFITEKEEDKLRLGDAAFFSYERVIVNGEYYYVSDQCKLWIYREKLPAVSFDIIHPHEMPVALLALGDINDLYLNPGFEKNALQFISALLKENQILKPTKTEVDEDEIKNLKTDTLYIPAEFLHNRPLTKLTHSDSADIEAKSVPAYTKDPSFTEADIKNVYPYPFKITSLAALNSMIMNDPKPHYYFWLTQGNIANYLCIMNSNTGNQLYVTYHSHVYWYVPRMYSISDFKDIAKEITKAK